MTDRLTATFPELVISAVAGFSLGPMILLLAGQFHTWPVIVTGLLGAAIAAWVCGRNGASSGADRDRAAKWWLLAAVALIAAWTAYNVHYTAENMYGTRDPATYNITARWLMDNPTLHIHAHPELFGRPVGFLSESPGFSDVNRRNPGNLYSQGNHLQPALTAVFGWVFGVQGMFRADVVIGAIALLALFALARRIVGHGLALLVTAVMAVGLPMVYVSRDMFSEPLMMIFLLGGLALLHRAVVADRRTDFALAGLVLGCSAMVRIDAYAALLAVIASAFVEIAIAGEQRRRRAVGHGIELLAGGVPPVLLGWLDVSRLSSGYYHDQHRNIIYELAAGLVLLLFGPLVVRVLWHPRVRDWMASAKVRSRAAIAAVIVLVAGFGVLASRPLWLVTRHAFDNPVLRTWQQIDGVKPDGTRVYYEQTLNWIADYFGWATVVLGVIGYALLLIAVIRRREYPLIAMVVLGLTMSGLYLWASQISPDQPWAMRRYVPVVLPLMLVAAATALRAVGTLRIGKWRWGTAVAAVLGAIVLIVPERVTTPMRHVREEVPMYSQVQAICRALGPSGAVVFVDAEGLGVYGQTMRAYCGVPAIGLIGAGPTALRAMAAAVAGHGRTLYVLSRTKSAVPFAPGASTEPFSLVRAQLWPNVINHVPIAPVYRNTDVYLGRVQPDGYVAPVPRGN